jgi:hypothetical protein
MLSEDARLGIIAHLITKHSQPSELYIAFKIVENFINFQVYEDAAPISTLETSIQIILLEYSEMVLKSLNHNNTQIDTRGSAEKLNGLTKT